MPKKKADKLYIYAQLGILRALYSGAQWETMVKAGLVTEKDVIERVWAYE